jgi:iron-sulfur cluster repair protein YtfE (RIC family)
MKPKPIKRNENIAKLSRDHHASLMFCWKLRQGIKKDVELKRMQNYLSYFLVQHFTPHFREEEDILFAPLKDEKVQKAIDDHVVILKKVADVVNSESQDLVADLISLADMVDAHVRYEERILFPHLENKLSEKQLEDIGQQISHDAIKDNYEDEFWVKAK